MPARMVRVTVTMPADTRMSLVAASQVMGRSCSWIMRQLIARYMPVFERNQRLTQLELDADE